MIVERSVMGYASTNTYFIKKGNKLIVIDPCIDPNNDSTRLLSRLEGYDVMGILLTHAHFDHISGVDAITKLHPCPVFVPSIEKEWLANPQLNLSPMIPELVSIKSEATGIEPGPLKVGDFEFDVIATPGHTEGSVSYIIDNHVFDGDFIMKQSMGRTDLPTGSSKMMKAAMIDFINTYKEKDFVLYPGHGDMTTLEDEILFNPFIVSLMSS